MCVYACVCVSLSLSLSFSLETWFFAVFRFLFPREIINPSRNNQEVNTVTSVEGLVGPSIIRVSYSSYGKKNEEEEEEEEEEEKKKKEE